MINPEIRAEILFQIVSYLLKGEIVSPQIASQNQALQSSAKCKLWHLRWHIVRFPTQVRWYNTNVCDHTVCQREGDLEAMRTLVHNKCSNIKWLSAVFVVIGRITYKIWTLSRQAKLTKNSNAKSLDAISLHLHPIVHCPRSKNQVVYQQVGKRHVDEDREERATRRVTSVAGLSGRWSEQRLLRSPSHSDYSEAAPRLWTVVPETGFPHRGTIHGRPQRHKRSHWGTNRNRNTKNKGIMMLKKQNTRKAW